MARKPTCERLEATGMELDMAAAVSERIEASLRFAQITIDHSSDSAFWMGADARFIYVNEAACKTLGYSREELLTMTVHDIDPDFPQEVWAEHWAELKRRGSFVVQSRHLSKEGRLFPVEVSVNYIEFGGKGYNCAFARDITQRMQGEEALRESEATLQSIFRAAPTGVGLVSNRILKRVNERICEMIGYSEEELVGQSARILYPTDEDFEYVGSDKYTQIREQGIGTVETRWQHKDGEIIDVLLSSAPLDPSDLSAGVTFTVLDISERKRAEDALRESEKRLRALASRLQEVEEAERKALARELHDQVGQTLTALNINLNIMRNQLDAESLGNVLVRLDDSSRLLEDATQRIRDVMAELRPQVLDDYGLTAALRWYGERFEDRTGILTVIHGDEISIRLAEAVESALFRIMQEALTNVAKHAEASQVALQLEETDGRLRLTIADDGKGFDPGALQTSNLEPGWGLLTMQERAQALGGQVHIESESGKGARVTVELQK